MTTYFITFANIFEAWSENKDAYVKIKKYMPNLTDEFEKIMKEVIDGTFD